MTPPPRIHDVLAGDPAVVCELPPDPLRQRTSTDISPKEINKWPTGRGKVLQFTVISHMSGLIIVIHL